MIYTCLKYQHKTSKNNKYICKKMKDRKKKKSGLVRAWIPVGQRRAEGDGEGNRIWWKYFEFLHENSRMKHVEIVLRRRDGGV
jgi:hypothetical protein